MTIFSITYTKISDYNIIHVSAVQTKIDNYDAGLSTK